VRARHERGNEFLGKKPNLGFGSFACRKKSIVE
jgi:hypothetical protein